MAKQKTSRYTKRKRMIATIIAVAVIGTMVLTLVLSSVI